MPHHGNTVGGNNFGCLSQPTYFYLSNGSKSGASEPETDNSMQTISMMSSELEVTDSQQDCECSQQVSAVDPIGSGTRANQRHAIESFSQPISTEHMYLNSQAVPTQPTETQVIRKLFSSCFY